MSVPGSAQPRPDQERLPQAPMRDETEAAIETGIAEQGDQRLAGGISRADHSVHERLPTPVADGSAGR